MSHIIHKMIDDIADTGPDDGFREAAHRVMAQLQAGAGFGSPCNPLENQGMPSTTIEMKHDKDCKGSVRYATTDEKAAVTNVYVSREFANPMPKKISVTIAAVE